MIKVIIKKDLERKNNSLFQDNSSIFEYREILEIINKGNIDRSEYRNFGLFYDNKLDGLSEKEIELMKMHYIMEELMKFITMEIQKLN